ncbi:MAG: hypothetical protein KAI47_18950, partial [Deltaproteobacteria bacterium]|nr:hypothetical protein [Deltaproteobacteria bacterium]
MFSVVVAGAGAAYAYLSGPLLALLLSGGRAGGGAISGLLPEGLRSLADGPLANVRNVGGATGAGVLWIVAFLLVAVAALKGGAQLAQTALL